MDERQHSGEIEEVEEIEEICCDCCGKSVPADDITSCNITQPDYPYRTNSQDLCESCYDDSATCYDCSRRFTDSDALTEICGQDRCSRCEEDYNCCDNCGEWLHNDDIYYDDNGTWCSDCRPSEDESELDSRIMSYNYKPAPRFFGKGKLFFGCELEINFDDCSDAVDWIFDNLGKDRIYLKEDGSLTNGFEIVSHPHTFEESIKLWSKMSQEGPFTSHKSGECGFHIHVSRAALSPLTIQKMIVFVNAPENAALVDKVAQRTANGYCSKKQAKIGHCKYSDSRYEAINLMNTATVEFRIFRGNTRPERLLKNLEFCHALIHWVQLVSYRQLTSALFTDYVTRHKKIYKNLHAFITKDQKENN